jgi:hypothetical protein
MRYGEISLKMGGISYLSTLNDTGAILRRSPDTAAPFLGWLNSDNQVHKILALWPVKGLLRAATVNGSSQGNRKGIGENQQKRR